MGFKAPEVSPQLRQALDAMGATRHLLGATRPYLEPVGAHLSALCQPAQALMRLPKAAGLPA
jgi:hypothetical protein